MNILYIPHKVNYATVQYLLLTLFGPILFFFFGGGGVLSQPRFIHGFKNLLGISLLKSALLARVTSVESHNVMIRQAKKYADP